MVEFKWIQTSLFLLLQFTAAAAETRPRSLTVRAGDGVTLSCDNVIKSQQKCRNTTWLFSDSGNKPAVELIVHVQIDKNTGTESDRLSLLKNCSLVIKKVTGKDAGRYTCRQFNKAGQQQGNSSQVLLSVINMTEHKHKDQVTLNCSLSTYERCRHTVKWLSQGKDVDQYNQSVKTSQSNCSANVTFKTSHDMTSRYELLECEVTDWYTREVEMFPFRARPSGEDATTTTTTSPATSKSTSTAGSKITTTERRNSTSSADKISGANWWLIAVGVGVAALLIIVVAVIIWRKTKGRKTQMDENVADPDVSYASISYTKKSDSKAQVLGKDDEDEAVTYSTVRASSSSAGASADPGNLYATVNKANK